MTTIEKLEKEIQGYESAIAELKKNPTEEENTLIETAKSAIRTCKKFIKDIKRKS